jgi:hypothetical protein
MPILQQSLHRKRAEGCCLISEQPALSRPGSCPTRQSCWKTQRPEGFRQISPAKEAWSEMYGQRNRVGLGVCPPETLSDPLEQKFGQFDALGVAGASRLPIRYPGNRGGQRPERSSLGGSSIRYIWRRERSHAKVRKRKGRSNSSFVPSRLCVRCIRSFRSPIHERCDFR